jgi:hypothetical protein
VLNVNNEWTWKVSKDGVYGGDLDKFSGSPDKIKLEWRSNSSTTGKIDCPTGFSLSTSKTINANEIGNLSLTASWMGSPHNCTISVSTNYRPDNKDTIFLEYAYNWDGDAKLGENPNRTSFFDILVVLTFFGGIPLLIMYRRKRTKMFYQPQMRGSFCSNCGKQYNNSFKFCDKCGKRFI